MKRFLALVLALVMCLALVACGGSKEEEKAPAKEEPTQSEAKQPDAPAEEVSTWPEGNVDMYVNQSAGGGSDMLARLLAAAMGEATGTNFVVINDTSGGTTTACEIVRTSDPSAEKILVCNTGTLTRMISGQYAQTLDGFSVLGIFTTPTEEGYGIFVSADSPFETLDDLLAYSKANPFDLMTNGQVGGFVMFMEAALQQSLDHRATFVEGGSDADRILNLMGGTMDYVLTTTISTNQYVEAGDVRCLAMVGPERSSLMPDVPTLDELGYTSLGMANVMMLLGPAGMSEADIERVGEVLKEANANATLQEGYAKMNMAWEYKTPAESKAFLEQIMGELGSGLDVVQEMGLA